MGRDIVAYYRVSTDLQGIDGHGMAAQQKAVETYAARMESSILASYAEVETGRRDRLDNRPELKRALAHAKRSRALLVIARLDRLARSVLVTAQLLASDVEFVACDNPHANQLTIHILAAMAEHEGHLISERTKAGLAAAKARGVTFSRKSHLTPEMRAENAKKAAATRVSRTRNVYADLIPQIASLRRQGCSAQAIAAKLNTDGQRNQYGNPWTIHLVRFICKRERLLPPPIVRDAEFFAKIQKACEAALDSRARKVERSDAEALPIVLELLTKGLSLTHVAQELNDRGISPPFAIAWKGHTVGHLLERNGRLSSRQFRRSIVPSPKIVAAAKTRVDIAREKRLGLVDLITRLQINGYSLDRIASTLNDFGYLTTRGKPWTRQRAYFVVTRHRTIEKRLAGENLHRRHAFTWEMECRRCSRPFVAHAAVARYCSKECKETCNRAARKKHRNVGA